MRLPTSIFSFISRRTMWAEGHVFAVTAERVSIAEGLRTSLAMGLMLAAAIFFHRIDFAYGAVAAFWNCLCDPLGSNTLRLRTMASFAVLGTVVMSAGSYGASWGPVAGGATLFGLVLLCGLLRSYKPGFGPMPLQAGLIASLAAVIGIASPGGLGDAVTLGGYFLLGSAWAILLFVYLWPIPRKALAERMLATLFGRLEQMAGFLEKLDARDASNSRVWNEFDTVYRRAVRISIERSRETAAQPIPGAAYLGRGVDFAGRVFAALIALGHLRREAVAQEDRGRGLSSLTILRDLLGKIAQKGDGLSPADEPLRETAASLMRETQGKGDPAARAIGFAANAIGNFLQQAQDSGRAPPPTPMPTAKAAFPVDAFVWRHALRVSVAVLVAYSIGIWLDVALSYWGVISALVVTQPIASNTWIRVLERACGSVIGGTIAAILLAHLSDPSMAAVAIVLLAVPVVALRLVNYGLFVVFLTPMFMLLSDFIRPADGLILARFANELVGAGIGIAASLLLWPENESNALNTAISTAVSANMTFASAVLRVRSPGSADLDHLQREAGLTSSRLETARQRMLVEGRSRMLRLDRLQNITIALRSVCGAATVLEIVQDREQSETDLVRANKYEALTTFLLKGSPASTSEPFISVAGEADDDLENAVRMLADALREWHEGKNDAR